MIKYVISKPVKKIKRTYTPIEKDPRKKKVWVRFFSIKIIWAIFGIFALIYGGFLLLRNTIFDTQYTIKRVVYDSGDIQRYDEPYMYRRISDWIKNENYYVVKRYKQRVLDDIQSTYPMVIDFMVTYVSTNTVAVKLTFKPIDLVIKNQTGRFAVVDNIMLPIYSGNHIWDNIKSIRLPEYLSGSTTVSGIFFRISAKDLAQQIDLLYQWFSWFHSMEYLPGGERTVIYLEGKKLYINNLWDIQNQIKNHELLKKYYKEYAQLEEIDLWSLEQDKVIVRKF